MKYRVTFRERSDERGERAEDPTSFLEPELDDSTVLDAQFVGRTEPDALHSSDRAEEDDAFLSLASEIWEYDVAEGREEDFRNALLNSGMVMEIEPLEAGDELGLS
ncbi:MAG TPA: hypothetical protein VKX25_13585 [Bryobacteraceae bacterium]|jgi:hypothetical protein|nr:hypothetical protein [Bryobacteraceae bacterium]